jgi:uncharacterized protein (DUF1697 family)
MAHLRTVPAGPGNTDGRTYPASGNAVSAADDAQGAVAAS